MSLTAMATWAPSAVAACSCMCVETTPLYVCTGFVNSQTQTAECDAMACPATDVPPPEPEPEPDPVEEPVATIEPPHPGLECERRSVYRPDLGRYKKYKVCKPSAEERHRRRHAMAERRSRHAEAWAARQERMQSRWEARQARWEAKMAKHRNRHHRGRHDHGGEDS
ncbi:MAG: hypothetical protein OES38_04500 [Gammaproteobacteria bacterium]|nr:hypothetical protein [Gammaproteobacteria bacterium]